jgi:hypothetical protein
MIDEARMIERRERGYVAGGRGKPPSGKERGYNCDKLFQSGETASQMKIRLYPLLIERPQSRYGSKSKANNVYMECGCFVDLKIEMLDQKKKYRAWEAGQNTMSRSWNLSLSMLGLAVSRVAQGRKDWSRTVWIAWCLGPDWVVVTTRVK